MTLKTGIWIDHQEAILVLLTDAGQALQKISLAPEAPATGTLAKGDGKARPKKYTPNDFVAEDRLERKSDAALKVFFDRVLASIAGAESLLILGPGQAKLEFQKRIKAKKLRGLAVELETTDKMTDRQLIAKVQKHFGVAPAAPPAAPPKKPTNKAKRSANREVKKAAKQVAKSAMKKTAKKSVKKVVKAAPVKAKMTGRK